MLKWLFYLPLTRELLLLSGASAVTKNSFENILSNNEKGEVVIVVVGGAAESLETDANSIKLILKKRKGFVRMALKTGSSLVPVFSFGENKLFNQLSNSSDTLLRNVQESLKHWTSIGFPMWWGRGLTESSFGFLAFNKPLHTVVGNPIDVKKNLEPTEDEVNELHKVYIAELIKLFEDNKEKFGEKSTVLEII